MKHLADLGPAALCVLALISGCDRARDVTAAPPPAAAASDDDPDPVEPPRAVAAEAGTSISRTLVLDSHLMVERNVGVTARRDGVIEAILAERGDRVKEDQPLARLERGDLLVSEGAALLDLEREQASWERAARLHEQSIIPKEEFEQVTLRRDAAGKALERIRYELSKCDVKAPFDGVISGRFVEKGQVVMEDDRRVLFQVTALGPLLARIYVPEWALFGLREGRPARVFLTTGPAAPAAPGTGAPGGIPARVRWINDVIDAASGSGEVLVEILGGSQAERLRPGMSVQVHLDLQLEAQDGLAGHRLVSVPREAAGARVPEPGQLLELRVLNGDGAAVTRTVVVGFVGDDRLQIRSGLSAGEMVVLP
ncbi:MAG TPA: efflux RND transporter periplasmic adaptor subunit [Candidatus Polarisedimenticolia bacterium]|nr:efflux RND transporter periplasmic adaptor subunit [Candidatus Polarisedimenticolia bacterium]